MKTQSFEDKIASAKGIIEKLMRQDIPLEDSVKLYEEGLQTIKEAQDMLENAKAKITVIEQESIKAEE
jgi:exodeoxyribonuclease VII small subunit